MPFDGMPQGHGNAHFVPVPTTPSISLDISGLFQIRDDALNGPFGDPDATGHVAHHNLGIGGDAEQYVRMIGEKRPPDVLNRRSQLLHFSNHFDIMRQLFHEYKSV